MATRMIVSEQRAKIGAFLILAVLVVLPVAHARLFNGQVNFGTNPRTGNFDIEIVDADGILNYRVLQGPGAAGAVEVPWTPAGDCPRRVRFPLPGPGGPHLRHKHRMDYHDCQDPPQRETWVLEGGVPFATGDQDGELQAGTRVVVAVPLDEGAERSIGMWLKILAALLVALVALNIAILFRPRS